MAILLYGIPACPPYRAVLLTAKAVGVEVQQKEVNIHLQENKTEAFLKMNPAHKIPVLDDNGFIVWESRAIMAYLVQQYGKDDKLYPKEPKKRAAVDNMLYYDATCLFASLFQYVFPMFRHGKPEDLEKKADIVEQLVIFNRILGDRLYAAGDQLTIADFSIISSLSGAEAAGLPLDDHPNVKQWKERIKAEVRFYDEVTKKGIEEINAKFASYLNK